MRKVGMSGTWKGMLAMALAVAVAAQAGAASAGAASAGAASAGSASVGVASAGAASAGSAAVSSTEGTSADSAAPLAIAERTAARPLASDEREDIYKMEEGEDAEELTDYEISFTMDEMADAYLDLFVGDPVETSIRLENEEGETLGSETISKVDWRKGDSGIYGYEFPIENLAAGEYVVTLRFAEATRYLFWVSAAVADPALNTEKTTVTAGFKKTLKVSDAPGKVTWSSSKKSVATVSSKGVVTGKKPGTATISAKTGGKTLKCKVTVKENVYSETKLTLDDMKKSGVTVQPYRASYASNGDLELRCQIVNNTERAVIALKDVKIKVRAKDGKTVGTCAIQKRNITVLPESTKGFRVTIRKSGLKNTNAELRGGECELVGGKCETSSYANAEQDDE